MQKNADVIVVGLGGMGAAATYQLAKRGVKVLGIDQFEPPHQLGSSGGETRVTRQAIGEGIAYSPFALRSYQIWPEIEAETGEDLLTITGGLIMTSYSTGSEMHGNKDFLKETRTAADKYGVNYRNLNTDEIRKEFPQFSLVGDEDGYYEPMMGFLRPENCIRAQLTLAKKIGAKILANTKVADILPDSGGGGYVYTADGSVYYGNKIIISVGAWLYKLLGKGFNKLFKVNRQVLYWFDAEPIERYTVGNFPVFIWVHSKGFIYGFPAIDGPGGGVKVASEETVFVDPDTVDRTVSEKEARETYLREVVNRLPDLNSRCVKSCVCMYTKTPDSGFVIDFYPDNSDIIVASPCSGHGFKHSAAIGESLAELATVGKSTLDIGPFKFNRFNKF